VRPFAGLKGFLSAGLGRSACLPLMTMAFSACCRPTHPVPPRPEEAIVSFLQQANFTRFSPAGPMVMTLKILFRRRGAPAGS